MENNLSEEQLKAKDNALMQGEAFDEMTRSRGWQMLQQEYANRIQKFVNGLLTADDIEIVKFEAERRELMGIRKMLGYVETRLQTYRDETRPTNQQT